MPDSTSSRMFSKWSGSGTIIEVRSPYSCIVDVDGVDKHFHPNKLRKFHVRVDSVTCDSLNDDLETRSVNTCAITYESDTDFGQLSTIPITLAPFGLKCSGNAFVRATNEILRPVRDYAESFF